MRISRTATDTCVTLLLEGLTPGGYRLRLTATDGAAAAYSEAGFVVR